MIEGNSLSYAVLGTGALGGLYGGLLAHSGCDVHFLLRSDYEHVRQHGLQIESPLGNFHLPQVQCYESATAMPSVDVVIVAWKTTANSALPHALEQICDPHSVVLVLQNGWDVESLAAQSVGAERVLGGCCFLCCNKIGPGHIQHLDFGHIVFGEYAQVLSGAVTPRMAAIAKDFQSAGIKMEPTTNLSTARWRKLMWNIPYNGLSVVLDADTQQLMQDSHGAALVQLLMREVQQIATQRGSAIEDSFIDKLLDDTRRMVPYDSSMRLDYLARRPMEVDAIFGSPLRAAHAVKCYPQQLQMLYHQLCFLDRQNREATAVADSEASAQDPHEG